MAKKKRRKAKKIIVRSVSGRESGKKKLHIRIIRRIAISSFFTIAFLALLFFVFYILGQVPEHQIYVSSETAKQGSTILIKVSGKYRQIEGNFDGQKIDFFKNKNFPDWVAFLGIDVNTKPGKYKITINSLAEKLEKEITIEPQEFGFLAMEPTKEMESKGFTSEKVAENITENDNPALNKIFEKFTENPYFAKSFSFPLKKVKISGLDFGQFVKNGNYELRHLGVDLRAPARTEVFAVNDGKVVFAKNLANYGKTIVIDHGMGIFSLYLHLSGYSIFENQLVKRGQIIGFSGNSGYSTAPHLHFSIRDNDSRVDPVSFIETTQKVNENYYLASLEKAFLKTFSFKKPSRP
jgi:murein DD-endopeptidase MepM/ murein hydrolase activator NlpD